MRTPSIILFSLVLMAFEVSNGQASLTAAATLSLQQETPDEKLRAADDSRERPRKLEIEFDGNKVFPTQQLLDHVNQCWDHYNQPGNKVDSQRAIDECLRQLAFFIRSQGYLQATFNPTKVAISESVVNVFVPVNEGIRYRIGEVRIGGSKLFSPAQIMEELDIKAGDIANGEKIGQGVFERLEKLYYDRGYLHYAAEPEPTFREISADASEGIVDFNIEIVEGAIFIIRSVKFKGNRATTDQDLKRALLVHEGEPYNEQLFQDSLEKLSQLGLFDAMPRGSMSNGVDFRYDEEGSLLDITIHIKERER